jgi:hypothetical protein
MMLLFASGSYTGIPDAHLVYINYIYGLLLIGLYTIFPVIEWYTVSFCVIHILSLSVIIWTIVRSNKNFLLKIAFILVFYSIEIYSILLFQFTTTAAICAIAGLILLIDGRNILKALGIFLFVLAFMIRYEAASLVLLLTLPLFAWQLYLTKSYKNIILPILVCILLAVFVKFIDYKIYSSDKNWKEYAEYNSIRGFINANPNRSKIYDKLPEEVSDDDYFLLLSFFADGKTIGIDSLKQINEIKSKIALKEKLVNIYPSLRSHFKFFLPISIMFIFLIIGGFKQRYKSLFLIVYGLLYIILLSVLSWDVTLKDRVFFSTLYPVFFLLFYISDFSFEKRFISIGIAFCCLFFTVFLCRKIYKIKLVKDENNIRFIQERRPIMERAKEKNIILLSYAADLSPSYNPFKISKLRCCKQSVALGWLVNIPLNNGIIDDYRDIVDANIGIFVSKVNEENIIPYLQRSLRHNYNYETELKYIDETEKYLLIKLIKKDGRDEK